MNKIFYNIQLISSFLLDKTRFLFIALLILLNGNSIFSLVWCDESIESLPENGFLEKKENNNNFALYFGIGLIIGVFITILYLNSGSSDGGGGYWFSNENTVNSIAEKPPVVDTLYSYNHAHTLQMNKLNSLYLNEQASNKSLLAHSNHQRAELCELQNYCETIQNSNMTVYNFLNKLETRHPNTSGDISRFIENNPPIIPRIF